MSYVQAMDRPSENERVKVFAWTVFVLGAIPIGASLWVVFTEPIPRQWMVLALLSVVSSLFIIRVPSLNSTISVSETLVFASALLFGPAPATVSVALDGLIVAIRSQNRRPYRMAFNIAEPAISIWVSAQLFYLITGIQPLFDRATNAWSLAVPLLLFASCYFVLNGILTAKAIELETRLSVIGFLRSNSSQLLLNFGVSVFLLFLVVSNANNLNFASVGIIAPVLILSYWSSKATMQVVEKSNKHLEELNELYLTTVETLAMAVDAKDGVTHGHVRRVQDAVIALAREVGVEDGGELNAIRAGALLHDLGKIAVPEYILHKPGPLNDYELKRMQSHSDMGANIVAKMGFPYPVEPIVRHHHESWDGSGYPAGLRGSEIPLGCRVLAIVDCYDAVRSHRPYRRQLTKDEALDIIRSRKGKMYDPQVVDAFIRILPQLELGDPEGTSAPVVAASERAPATSNPLDRSAELPATLPSWVTEIAPDAVIVLYAYDVARDVLTPAAVSAGATNQIADLVIPMGSRVTGWVAAHRQAQVNADAQLDIEGRIAVLGGMRRCVCVPVGGKDKLLGVLSLYSEAAHGFNDEQVSQLAFIMPDVSSLFDRHDSELHAPGPRPQSATSSSRTTRTVRLIGAGRAAT